MNATPEEHEWLALCQIERDCRTWLTEHASETTSDKFRKRLREWWRSIERLLDFHAKALVEYGEARQNIPIPVLSALRGFAGYLAVGQIPGPIPMRQPREGAASGRHIAATLGLLWRTS
jgi:hypothetical protein